jgi:diphosphomevalonate decarboxylase
MGGYVEWPAPNGAGDGEEEDDTTNCYAHQVAPAEHWDLRNVIAILQSVPKKTSSLDGHRRAQSSPYFSTRLRELPKRLETVRQAIAERDFEKLGATVEAEAIDLHCVAMTSDPAIFYWQPGTLTVLETVRQLRADGVPAWSTMDAGANVHVLCLPASEADVAERLAALPAVEKVLRDGVGNGPIYEDQHLL